MDDIMNEVLIKRKYFQKFCMYVLRILLFMFRTVTRLIESDGKKTWVAEAYTFHFSKFAAIARLMEASTVIYHVNIVITIVSIF